MNVSTISWQKKEVDDMAIKVKINFEGSTYEWGNKGNIKKGYSPYKIVHPKHRWSGELKSDELDLSVEKYILAQTVEAINDMRKENVHRYQMTITFTHQEE